MVLATTKLMGSAWERNLANNSNPFDEAIEQVWIKEWLFYANTIRYASAMTGAQKYTAFTDGWWDLTHNLQELKDRIFIPNNEIGRLPLTQRVQLGLLSSPRNAPYLGNLHVKWYPSLPTWRPLQKWTP